MADKFHSDTQEKVETIIYKPGLQDSGDLEAGTRTITATSEASGLGNADYDKTLTLVRPTDARLVIRAIATRLAVTIDSFDAATHLYCRVYVDAQDADHRLYDEDWNSTGAKLDAEYVVSGTIFDLLSDGNAHTFYFFFWVDQANNAVISLVQLGEAVGSSNIGGYGVVFLSLVHTGEMTFGAFITRQGTGSSNLYAMCPATGWSSSYVVRHASVSHNVALDANEVYLVEDETAFRFVNSSVTTDLWALEITIRLRSMQ